MSKGYYYLHSESGDLIYKRDLGGTVADLRESDFVEMFWPVDDEDRQTAWDLLVEAMAIGVSETRVDELVRKWKCDDADAAIYAEHVGAKLFKDGDMWCATGGNFINLQESPAGFGETCLKALAELCKALEYKPRKLWGERFTDLLVKV